MGTPRSPLGHTVTWACVKGSGQDHAEGGSVTWLTCHSCVALSGRDQDMLRSCVWGFHGARRIPDPH